MDHAIMIIYYLFAEIGEERETLFETIATKYTDHNVAQLAGRRCGHRLQYRRYVYMDAERSSIRLGLFSNRYAFYASWLHG